MELRNADNNVLLLFTTYFRSLERLLCQKFNQSFQDLEFNESFLENIFKYQLKLRYLILDNRTSPPRFIKIPSTTLCHWLEIECEPYHQLNYLTHLHVMKGQSLDLSEFLLSKFAFPNLRSLILSSAKMIMIFFG